MKADELKIETALANNDVLLNIAPYLDCSDLVNLALTSKRFGLEQEEHDHTKKKYHGRCYAKCRQIVKEMHYQDILMGNLGYLYFMS